jgi:hypothetical protein
MHRRDPAVIGAWTLGHVQHVNAVDSTRSIELVGGSWNSSTTSWPKDPIAAARRWLVDPTRARHLDPAVSERADRAIDVAELYFERLNRHAAELASEFEHRGEADPLRLAHVDEMATVLQQFSDRLRSLLDPASRSDDAYERLNRGLTASLGSDLRALVDAI